MLVPDMENWRRAAKLAREHEYRHGVLVPDYRGRSKYDDQGLYPRIDVHEDDYAHLVARLVRHLQPTEPETPLEPSSHRDRILAADGFLATRIEARATEAENHYLGRRARERRRERLESRVEDLERKNRRRSERAAELREHRDAVEERIDERKTRLEWERRRDELGEVETERTKLEGRNEPSNRTATIGDG